MPLAGAHDLEGLVVVVAANLADRHFSLLSSCFGGLSLPAARTRRTETVSRHGDRVPER
jgi:hypothetical protein